MPIWSPFTAALKVAAPAKSSQKSSVHERSRALGGELRRGAAFEDGLELFGKGPELEGVRDEGAALELEMVREAGKKEEDPDQVPGSQLEGR